MEGLLFLLLVVVAGAALVAALAIGAWVRTSIELRLTAAALVALGLLVVGWRLRTKMPGYALTLQGGSIGALYLTSFAAFRALRRSVGRWTPINSRPAVRRA